MTPEIERQLAMMANREEKHRRSPYGIQDQIITGDVLADFDIRAGASFQRPEASFALIGKRLQSKKVPSHLRKTLEIRHDVVEEVVQQRIEGMPRVLFGKKDPNGLQIGVEIRGDAYGMTHDRGALSLP